MVLSRVDVGLHEVKPVYDTRHIFCENILLSPTPTVVAYTCITQKSRLGTLRAAFLLKHIR